MLQETGLRSQLTGFRSQLCDLGQVSYSLFGTHFPQLWKEGNNSVPLPHKIFVKLNEAVNIKHKPIIVSTQYILLIATSLNLHYSTKEWRRKQNIGACKKRPTVSQNGLHTFAYHC